MIQVGEVIHGADGRLEPEHRNREGHDDLERATRQRGEYRDHERDQDGRERVQDPERSSRVAPTRGHGPADRNEAGSGLDVDQFLERPDEVRDEPLPGVRDFAPKPGHQVTQRDRGQHQLAISGVSRPSPALPHPR